MRRFGRLHAVCSRGYGVPAFCLIEVVAALTILVFVTISILAVYDRCMAAAADSTLKMQAFEVARENMENLLAQSSVELKVENGQSEIYPDILWQTSVESFYEPLTSRTWLQAICTANYFDTSSNEQTIELKHWLTELSQEDIMKMADQNEPNMPQTNEPNATGPVEPNKIL
jgi:type II secretory pathway pseudopilin PulG